jgi:hypothetical protein
MTTKRLYYAVGISIAVIVAILFGDWLLRCHGKPLSRQEALQRANVRLQYLSRDWVLSDPMPSLTSEQFDLIYGTWMFTFKSSTCEVSIIQIVQRNRRRWDEPGVHDSPRGQALNVITDS